MTTAYLSTLLVWGAATALAISMIAYSVDLARRTEHRAGRNAARRAQTSLGATAKSSQVLVGAARGQSGGTRGAGRAGRAEQADRAERAAEQASQPPADPRRAAGIGRSTAWLGAVLLLAAIVARGIAAGRPPWANMYEFSLVASFIALAVYLAFSLRTDLRYLGAFVTGVVTLYLVLAVNKFYVVATGVRPALQSYWLVIHIPVAMAAVGVFTVAFAFSVLQLLRTARAAGSAAVGRWHWLDKLPDPATLEVRSFRLNAIGLVLWTFTLIAGAVWAENAWGRYWGWDPKEVWSFIVWIIYAAYLHARTTRGWDGNRAAWFVVVGYACVLWNFTGVNLLINGKHSYSGLTK
jgi:cytochrome c-type biogenesis protein CcsB